MEIKDKRIDCGKAFDWGRASDDYAKFRDIYPEEFYDKIARRGLCVSGQNVLDVGTGTGVLPRNMYKYGARWTAADISSEQIAKAKELTAACGMEIDFRVSSAEQLDFPLCSFDVITACQCFWYFDHERAIPRFAELLKPKGALLILYMAWLPFEDEIAAQSEALVLKYNPEWSGAGETRRPISVPNIARDYFDIAEREEYDVSVSFTRESWHGRMRACRGVGASLSPEKFAQWDAEHRALLSRIAPERFEVAHYAALARLTKK